MNGLTKRLRSLTRNSVCDKNKITKTEKIMKTTHIFIVNDSMVVADTIEEAIEAYRSEHVDEPRKVQQMSHGNPSEPDSWEALIKK